MKLEIIENQVSYSITYAKLTAVFSFVVGIIIFLIYNYNPNVPYIVGIGLCFLFFAFIINSLVLLRLIYYWTKYRERRSELRKLILIISINIPIAVIITYLSYKVFMNNLD